MRQTTVPNSGPKLKLVEAAERLIAEMGFDLVSVRDITQAAGGNVAAVNYHFGSRDGLVQVVMNRHLVPLMDAWQTWLEDAELDAGPLSASAIVGALVSPIFSQVGNLGLETVLELKLIGRMLATHHHGMPTEIQVRYDGLINRFNRMIETAKPIGNKEDLTWGLRFGLGALSHLLTHGQALSPGADMADLGRRLVRFVAAGLTDGGPVMAAPVIAEPVIVEPVIVEPVIVEPVIVEPVIVEPVIAEPVIVEPVIVEPVALEPVIVEPVIVEPVAASEAGSSTVVNGGDGLEVAEAEPKPARKRAKKAEGESPQVFFDF